MSMSMCMSVQPGVRSWQGAFQLLTTGAKTTKTRSSSVRPPPPSVARLLFLVNALLVLRRVSHTRSTRSTALPLAAARPARDRGRRIRRACRCAACAACVRLRAHAQSHGGAHHVYRRPPYARPLHRPPGMAYSGPVVPAISAPFCTLAERESYCATREGALHKPRPRAALLRYLQVGVCRMAKVSSEAATLCDAGAGASCCRDCGPRPRPRPRQATAPAQVDVGAE
jgi:hypothetical protein